MYEYDNMEYWRVYKYLRKSRKDEQFADEPLEATLRRHDGELIRLAKKYNLNIVKTYREVETGDSIAVRPQMLELLADIEENNVDAVLVIDIDRLGRGDMQDQGYILSLFKRKSIKIITPLKIYDLNDEIDEDNYDFQAFFARKELMMIKRRFARGRQRSLNEGNYIGAYAPYGYEKYKKSLIINEKETDVVRLMFDLYVNKDYGDAKIAKYLDQHGIPNRNGNRWERTTIRRMINNPIYIGMIAWNKRNFTYIDGRKASSTLKPPEAWNIYKGRHPAIIDEDIFNKAQQLSKDRYVPHSHTNILNNPLSYIMKCGACGYTMSQRKSKDKAPSLRCHKNCGGVMSTYVDLVEEKLISQLTEMLKAIRFEYSTELAETSLKKELNIFNRRIAEVEKKIEKLKKKRLKQYDLLEDGVYTPKVFEERGKVISKDIDDELALKEKLFVELTILNDKINRVTNVTPKVNSALDFIENIYWDLDAEHKNEFLRTIIDKVVYTKPKGSAQLDFKLDVLLKL